jgi:hypothetical protein
MNTFATWKSAVRVRSPPLAKVVVQADFRVRRSWLSACSCAMCAIVRGGLRRSRCVSNSAVSGRASFCRDLIMSVAAGHFVSH